jgi:peptidoglycan hydrolase-like protein with peptidoglycan-binding domain
VTVWSTSTGPLDTSAWLNDVSGSATTTTFAGGVDPSVAFSTPGLIYGQPAANLGPAATAYTGTGLVPTTDYIPNTSYTLPPASNTQAAAGNANVQAGGATVPASNPAAAPAAAAAAPAADKGAATAKADKPAAKDAPKQKPFPGALKAGANGTVGSTGADVTALQKQLNAAGAKIQVDGKFGPATQAALKAYQKAHGVTATGKLDQATWDKLNPAPKAAKVTAGGEKGPDAAPAAPEKGKPVTYTVKPGDNLTKIAAAHGVDWHELYDANKKVVGGDPNLIRPGQEFTIPGKFEKPAPKPEPKAKPDPAKKPAAATPTATAAAAPATTTATTGGGATATSEQQKQIEQVHTIDGLISNGVGLIFKWENDKRQPGISQDTLNTLQSSINSTEADLERLRIARQQLAAVLGPLTPPSPDNF